MSSVIPQGLESSNNNNNARTDITGDNCGWNFIQALTNSANNVKKVVDQTEEVYVHPLVKRSASTLSTKSLEMCTESLGSETGSDISIDELIPPLSPEIEKMQLSNEGFSTASSERKRINGSNYREFSKKMSACQKFPPPLTSFSGFDGGVQVRPHREGGRLILKAATVTSSHSNFQADRRDGRLRLSLIKESCAHFDNATMIEEEEGEEVVENENEVDISENEQDKDEDCWCEEMEGKAGCEMGIGELGRPSRCKETDSGRRKMTNWGSYWVAIS